MARRLEGHTARSKSTSFAESTSYFIDNTVGVFFRGDHLNWANTLKSLLLSLAALPAVVVALCLVNNLPLDRLLTIYGDFRSGRNLVLLGILAVGCLVTDVVSFLQTAMFMRVASRIGSLRDMLFMAACDLIVTINLFIFIFPVFLGITIFIVDHWGRRFEVVFEYGRESNYQPNSEKETERERQKRFADLAKNHDLNHYSISVAPRVLRNGGLSERAGYAQMDLATRGVEVNTVMAALVRATGNQPRTIKRPPDSDREKLRHLLKSLPDNSSSADALLPEDPVEFIAATMTMRGGLAETPFIDAYFELYKMSHAVQDQFLELAALRVIGMNLNRFMIQAPGYSEPVPNVREYFIYCDGEARFSDTIHDEKRCEREAVVHVRRAFLDTYARSYIFEPALRRIPISVFATTGLFLTFVFYLAMLVFVLTAALAGLFRLLAIERPLLNYRSFPFSAASIYIVLVLLPTVILGTFVVSRLTG